MVLFYLKLMVESIDHEGMLRFSDTLPYSEEMLACVTNTEQEIVHSALCALTELGLVAIGNDRNGRMLTCIDLRPLPDEIAHTINRKYQQSAREDRQIRQKTSGNVLQSGD